MGLGDCMMGWVLARYEDPRARVKVNGTLSEYFHVRSGTRQGCPLSPLLFYYKFIALASYLTSK